jgi:hypothetical protein
MWFKKILFIGSFFVGIHGYLCAQESWIVPFDSDVYEELDELYINEWRVAPLDEMPMVADDLRTAIARIVDNSSDDATVSRGVSLLDELRLPMEPVSPILETSLFTAYNSEEGRRRLISTTDTSMSLKILDFTYLYDVDRIPPLVSTGFIAQAEGFSMLFEPTLKPSNTYLLDFPYVTNIPFDIVRLNTNFPQRGIGVYYNPPFEFRFGRDKLKTGPGKLSTLSLNQNVPYFDFLKARFFVDWFTFSFYIVQLNPTISPEESNYLDDLYDNNANPEYMGNANGKAYVERAKYLVISRATMYPFPWLSFTIMQMNLIGGRYPWFSDLNPFAIYHNTFAEGVYSVPFDFSCTVVPYKGVKLYFDFLLYDATVADETNPYNNPTAFAYQFGFTLLSDPFFKFGPGRFRLDGECALVDPWTYGKFYDLRKFTSRVIYIESYYGRFWIDYPLGFYLGPDVVDFNLSLSYALPGSWDFVCFWNLNGKGEINLYGWGDENDYSHIGDLDYQPTGAPSGVVQWTNSIEFSVEYHFAENLLSRCWYRLKSVLNQYNVTEDVLHVYHYVGFEARWKLY